MKLKQLFFIFAAAGLLLGACSKDNEGGGQPQEYESAQVTVQISTPSALSRADGGVEEGTMDESKLTNVEFFIFNANGQPDSQQRYYNHTIVNGMREADFKVDAGNGKLFLAAANMNIGDPGAAAEYDDVKELIASLVFSEANSRTIPTAGLPMSGEQEADVTANVPNNRVVIRLARLVSKVTAPVTAGLVVELDPDDQDDILPGTTDTPTFTFLGYSLINGIDKSDLFPIFNSTGNPALPWDEWVRKNYLKTQFNPSDPNKGDISKAYSGQHNSSWWLDGSATGTERVFVYENDPQSETSPGGMIGFKRDQVYAFLIKGKLESEGEEATRYWRVNIIMDDDYRIIRNAAYKVTINKITTPGYGTAEEAEEGGGGPIPGKNQTGILATIQVLPWTVKTQVTDM